MSALAVGSTVRVLDPFAPFFPGTYTVSQVDDPNTTAYLDGIDSAFDYRFLEVVDG